MKTAQAALGVLLDLNLAKDISLIPPHAIPPPCIASHLKICSQAISFASLFPGTKCRRF